MTSRVVPRCAATLSGVWPGNRPAERVTGCKKVGANKHRPTDCMPFVCNPKPSSQFANFFKPVPKSLEIHQINASTNSFFKQQRTLNKGVAEGCGGNIAGKSGRPS